MKFSSKIEGNIIYKNNKIKLKYNNAGEYKEIIIDLL